jgi:hypothetical protein
MHEIHVGEIRPGSDQLSSELVVGKLRQAVPDSAEGHSVTERTDETSHSQQHRDMLQDVLWTCAAAKAQGRHTCGYGLRIRLTPLTNFRVSCTRGSSTGPGANSCARSTSDTPTRARATRGRSASQSHVLLLAGCRFCPRPLRRHCRCCASHLATVTNLQYHATIWTTRMLQSCIWQRMVPAASNRSCGRCLPCLCLALLRHPVQEEDVCFQRRAVHLSNEGRHVSHCALSKNFTCHNPYILQEMHVLPSVNGAPASLQGLHRRRQPAVQQLMRRVPTGLMTAHPATACVTLTAAA